MLNLKSIKEYYKTDNGTLYHGDCLKIMPKFKQKFDMVLTDPPYGTTACKWDSIIPLEPMWKQLKKLIKPNGAIAMTASQPFTTTLISSNIKIFRYCWIWEKTLFTNFALVKKQPAKKHEDVCIFYYKQPTYNPQMETGKPYTDKKRSRTMGVLNNALPMKKEIINTGTRYPSSVQKFSNGNNNSLHPTQKPIALMEYLIKTYTNENETILDFTSGSGTTGIACERTNRKWIMIEKEEKHCEITVKRIKREVSQRKLSGF